MRRRGILGGLGALAAPVASGVAQSPARTAQIGFLATGISPWMLDLTREVLRTHGFAEGRNLAIHLRSTEDRYDRLQMAARELVALGVDVIRTRGESATRAAHDVTTSVPIVMNAGSDPVALGYARSLSRPGGNVTGIISRNADLAAKRLQLLVEAFPGRTRAATVYSAGSAGQTDGLRQTQAAAEQLGVELLVREVNRPEEYEPAMTAFAAEGATVFVPVQSTMLGNQAARVADASRRLRLPTIFGDRAAVEAGGLMSYGVDLRLIMRRGAEYVVRILKGEKPADIPFERIDRLELVINLRTARETGVTLAPSLLAAADEVIE